MPVFTASAEKETAQMGAVALNPRRSSTSDPHVQAEGLAQVQHAENVRVETLHAQHQLAPAPGATQHVALGQYVVCARCTMASTCP
jgi:hypothetical protein